MRWTLSGKYLNLTVTVRIILKGNANNCTISHDIGALDKTDWLWQITYHHAVCHLGRCLTCDYLSIIGLCLLLYPTAGLDTGFMGDKPSGDPQSLHSNVQTFYWKSHDLLI